jgi:hypothetical protein
MYWVFTVGLTVIDFVVAPPLFHRKSLPPQFAVNVIELPELIVVSIAAVLMFLSMAK